MKKNKKNISILTLNGYSNYGNRLQLFSLSKIIKTIRPDYEIKVYWPKNVMTMLKEMLKYHTPLVAIKYKKEGKLRKFTKSRLPVSVGHLKDCFCSIVGSDQVWNPDYLKTRPYLLEVPNHSKKISYAASIGYSHFFSKQMAYFNEYIKNYSNISVREVSAKDLLQPLTNKQIEVVLDPTLLLRKNDYNEIEKRPKDIKENENFVLCYILGGREQMDAINNYAKMHNCKIILFSDKKESNYGVEEFLYLIHHAQLICTDSFHACVFSFIFERPFVAFKRTGEADYMYTRLQNLIDTFQLKNREFNGKEITEENLKADYNNAKKILKKEQEKSLNFLKNALDIKEKQ